MLSTKQLHDTVFMMFSPRSKPLKHVLLPLYKCLKAYPNHHLRNKMANIILPDSSRIVTLPLLLTCGLQRVIINGVSSGGAQGSVLGPLLFYHANDLLDRASSQICKFADNCLLHRPIKRIIFSYKMI